MGKEQVEELKKHGNYVSVPRGISMRPMIYGQRDAVLIETLKEKPKRYDLVMYLRPNGQGVIHRVIRQHGDNYIICGDNCYQLEHVKLEQIAGIITKFNRKGKWYSIDNKWYQLYVHIWVDFLFLKRPLFYVRDKIKRKLHAIKNRHEYRK
jgi:hypothetical protein